ncbi:MAG: sodium-dependent transporter, partial [bacterium]
TYPRLIGLLPFGAAVFGILFFTLLLTLGIDSAFSLVEAGVAGGIDKWKKTRLAVNLAVSTALFLVGVIYATRAGLMWLDLIDNYMTNIGLTFVGMIECLAVGWFFGAGRLRRHVNEVSDFKIGRWWDFCILVLTPAVLFYILAVNVRDAIAAPYGGYPPWAQFAGGWGLIAFTVAASVVLMLIPSKGDR